MDRITTDRHVWIGFIRVSTRALLLSTAVVAGLSAGCGSKGVQGTFAGSNGGRLSTSRPLSQADRMPWELWAFDRALDGSMVRSEVILSGDSFMRRDARREAVEEYRSALTEDLNAKDREALMLRLAGTELSLGYPDRAAEVLAVFFEEAGATVDRLDARFSLLLAYVYGARAEVDQALAWFSRARSISAGKRAVSDTATSGARRYLSSLSEDEIDGLNYVWNSDSFISALIGEELSRRARGGAIVTRRPFWYVPKAGLEDEGAEYVDAAPVGAVGVLLPLSGRYGTLGESARQGIELAFAQRGVGSLSVQDTEGDPRKTIQLLRSMAENDPAMVIGPLVGSAAEASAQIAERQRVPLLVLSKSAELRPIRSVVQLGATPESQVRSLVRASKEYMGHRRFAMIYPETREGHAFADAFQRELRNQGLGLSYQSSYQEANAVSFTRIATELETQGVDALFFPDRIDVAAQFAQTISQRLRSQITLLGTARWNDSQALYRSRRMLKGALYVSPFFGESRRPEIQSFKKSYKDTYGREPTFLAAQGYDAATLSLKAMDRQQERGGSVIDALASLQSFDGVTGRTEISPGGRIRRSYTVVRVGARGMEEVADRQTPSYTMQGDVRY